MFRGPRAPYELILPSAFSITLGLFPSMIATHEFVVPRSIPMMLLSKELRRCSFKYRLTQSFFGLGERQNAP